MSRTGMYARSRRTALRILAGTPALLALAACGEASPDPTTPPPSTGRSDLDAALRRAQTVAATVTEQAPDPGSSLPKPGESRKVLVGALPLEIAGGRLFALFANGLPEAGRLSEGRYDFDAIPLDRYESDEWRMSRALMAAEPSAPELMAHFGTDLDDLVGHDQLLPLDDFLAADPDFDAGAFWPGALETGQREGVQFGLPFAVSPDFTFVNGQLAAERGIELPDPSLQAFTTAAYLRTAQAFHEPDPPDGGVGTRGILGVVLSEPTARGDYIVIPPVTDALLSALGEIRDSAGGFTPLQSEKARDVLEFYRDLTHRHELLPIGGFDLDRYREAGTWGLGFTTIAFSQTVDFGTNNRVYPFPNFGSGRNPAGTFLLSVVKSAKDPDVAYDAFRHLYSVMALESSLPPYRVKAEAIRRLMPELHGDDEHVLVHLLENAVFHDLSMDEFQVLGSTLVRDVLLGDTDPGEGLRKAIEELQATSSGS
ncbi:MAG: ABC transporter substrate-binding protein [Chloroflexota bacterium]|nr:ABC transporter substrate-binding protein [Chloroflexota bacterium]MDE2920774.1 ABC transporter substrate-binding protein [Chloroflexota bacterium]